MAPATRSFGRTRTVRAWRPRVRESPPAPETAGTGGRARVLDDCDAGGRNGDGFVGDGAGGNRTSPRLSAGTNPRPNCSLFHNHSAQCEPAKNARLPSRYGKLTSQFSRSSSNPDTLPETAATRKQSAPKVLSVERYLAWGVVRRYVWGRAHGLFGGTRSYQAAAAAYHEVVHIFSQLKTSFSSHSMMPPSAG